MSVYTHASFNLREQSSEHRIVVIDNEPIIAFAIRKLLIYQNSSVVVAHCLESNALIELCRKVDTNLVIFDPTLPGLQGVEFVKRLKRIFPSLKIILYVRERNSMISIDEFVQCGVDAIVLKKNSITNLQKAIYAVTRNFTFMDKELSACINKNDSDIGNDMGTTLALPKLSNREKQVLKLVTEGCTNKIIASKLSISIKTVESHRLNMMRKLDAHNVIDLVLWARRLNIS